MEKTCLWCCHNGNKLPVIGDRRKNGRNNVKDWNGRKYHVECYRQMRTIREVLVLGGNCVKEFDEKYC